MDSELVPMSRVDCLMSDWTAMVHVVEADRTKAAERNGVPFKFRRFQFGDSQGITISAVVYDEDIARIEGLLLPFRKYYISNAQVCDSPEPVQTGLYRCYWIITGDTVIQEALDVGEPVLPFYFQLRTYGSFHFVADTNNFINVIGVVVHAFSPRDVYVNGALRHGRDYVIINQSKCPVVFTLWDDYEAVEGRVIDELMPSMPIIIAIRVKVTTCNYISLCTQPSSVILIGPDVPEAKRLDSWCDANVSDIIHMVFDQKAYADPAILLPPVADPTLTPISNAASFTKLDRGTVWVKACVEVAWPMTRFWYLACPHCYDPYNFADTLGILCPSCHRGMYHFPRAWIRLTIHDDSGYLNVIALGPEAEELIGCSGEDMYGNVEDQVFAICKQVARRIEGKRFLCYLKHSSDLIASTTFAKYTIVKLYSA